MYLPKKHQSDVIGRLDRLGVPAALLPPYPDGKSGSVGLGDNGVGHATLLFHAADGDTVVDEYDRGILRHVVLCQPWKGGAPDHGAVLRKLLSTHPKCFGVADREGGGFSIKPLTGPNDAGDLVQGPLGLCSTSSSSAWGNFHERREVCLPLKGNPTRGTYRTRLSLKTKFAIPSPTGREVNVPVPCGNMQA